MIALIWVPLATALRRQRVTDVAKGEQRMKTRIVTQLPMRQCGTSLSLRRAWFAALRSQSQRASHMPVIRFGHHPSLLFVHKPLNSLCHNEK